MIEINLTIVIQVLQFLILVFLLNRLLFRPIGEVVAERQEKIAGWEEKTRALQESVRARLESYENRILEAKTQVQGRQAQLSNEVKEKEKEELRAAAEEAARLVASTQQALEDEIGRLRGDLRQQAEEMSQMLAAKVLGRKV